MGWPGAFITWQSIGAVCHYLVSHPNDQIRNHTCDCIHDGFVTASCLISLYRNLGGSRESPLYPYRSRHNGCKSHLCSCDSICSKPYTNLAYLCCLVYSCG